MPVSTELLEILVCPETRQPVTLATPERLEELNQKIRSGELRIAAVRPSRRSSTKP